MSIAERKRRARLEREHLILSTAKRMFMSEGYLGVTMAQIGEGIHYSKGTVYQHFSCKEEIIAALADIANQNRHRLLEHASRMEGRPRERMYAYGAALELFARRHGDDLRIISMIDAESLRRKTSKERQQRLVQADRRALFMASELVDEAQAKGDLEFDSDATKEDLLFGLGSLLTSSLHVYIHFDPDQELGVQSPFLSARRNGDRLLDAYGWSPLSTELDYESVYNRALEEIAAREKSSTAGAQGWTEPVV